MKIVCYIKALFVIILVVYIQMTVKTNLYRCPAIMVPHLRTKNWFQFLDLVLKWVHRLLIINK
jgi:hypothetical protein